MDPPDHSHNQNTPIGFGGSGEELTYGSGQQFPPGMVGAPDGTIQPPTAQPVGARQRQKQLARQFLQSQHAQQLHHRREQERESLRQQLQAYWENQRQEIERVNDFNSPSVPRARVKKIMKANEDVRMVSAEALVLFAKACEMFTSELTLCAWNHTAGDERTSIQKTDVAAALAGKEIFDFLHHIVPKEVQQVKDEAAASVPGEAMLVPPWPPGSSPYRYWPMPPQLAPRVGSTSGVTIGNLAKDPGGTSMPVPGPSGSLPYGYMPPQHAPQVGIAGVIMGDPAMDPNLYAQKPYHYMAPQGGTAAVITGDPAMDPNLYAQQRDPYVAPSRMLQQQPPEQQEAQQMWPLQQLEQEEAPQMWPLQQLEQEEAPQMWPQQQLEQQRAPQMWPQQPPEQQPPPQIWPQQPPEQQPPPPDN